MARKGRRGSVRTKDPRVVERILENARFLREHPEHAAPICTGSCPLLCTFRRARFRVRRVHKRRDDPDKLKKLGKRFHELGRAYSGVLRLAEAGPDKVEYLQNVNTPRGKVSIAPWSQAPASAHVGLQHRHDPSLRLLSAVPFLSEGDLMIATDEGLVCVHDGPLPEEGEEGLVEVLSLSTDGDRAQCPHISTGDPSEPHIVLHVAGARRTLHLCHRCSGGNSFLALQGRMVTKTPLRHVQVEVVLPPLEGQDPPEVPVDLPEPVLRAYVRGERSDQDLYNEAREARTLRLETLPEPLVVVGRHVHRPPFDDLVARLDPAPPLDRLLVLALEHLDHGAVLDKETPVGLLHELWPDTGEAALTDLLGAQGADLYDPGARLSDLERLVRTVSKKRSRQRVARELPSYQRVPPPVDLVDEATRALVARGRSDARQLLTSPPPRSHQAIALALARALDLSPSWTIDPRERDMAEALEPQVSKVLEARGEDYHEALERLLKSTGSTETLAREDAHGTP